MSIADQITRLQGVKADIISAIQNKGVDVPSGATLGDCPDLIEAISGGGVDPSFKDDIYYKMTPAVGPSGATEIDWRVMPNGYTRKTAVVGNVSRLDCGFSPVNNEFEITIDFSYAGGGIYEVIIATPYHDEESNIVRIIRVSDNSIIINADSRSGMSSTLPAFNGRHIMSFGRRGGIRYGLKDFTTPALSNNTNGNLAPQENLYMFDGVDNPVTSTIYRLYAKVNGTTVADFIPCVRDSDGIAGFYDFANNMFRTSEDGGVSLVAID